MTDVCVRLSMTFQNNVSHSRLRLLEDVPASLAEPFLVQVWDNPRTSIGEVMACSQSALLMEAGAAQNSSSVDESVWQ